MANPPTVSSTERIRDLSAISSDVPSLLTSASAALASLSGRPPPSTSENGDIDIAMSPTGGVSSTPSLQDSKIAFTNHAQAYFTTLQAVMARLRRQAYALEEAGIIGAEAPVLSAGQQQGQERQQQQQAGRLNINQGAGVRRNVPAPAATGLAGQKPQEEADRITHGGLGNLDVAWLNSRVGKGGLEKESEVLEEGKKLLEDVLRSKEGQDANMTD
ncbi:hypothetical protein K461DRAFT_292057 [Myriangium duriaei CBS 260.36]|uniref:Mediator of RNA polymerase II transcription subunit 11 n=1 Tax=Myriangium duriaei CBS 260.36 TaxID=1168546 RepID=A0A9P4MMG3_9PEZI|nr:hypothetical protein K461DRAFT_292057 [Myriangium duriaei CBS 260.36]